MRTCEKLGSRKINKITLLFYFMFMYLIRKRCKKKEEEGFRYFFLIRVAI